MTDGAFVSPFPVEDPEALAAVEAAQRELAGSVRRLLDACVRTRVDIDTMATVAREADGLTARLLETAQDGPLGIETSSDGRLRDHANPMVGMRNPLAPPLVVRSDGEGGMRCTFTLGAAYEGPPGCIHGGIIAAILDQVLGSAAAAAGRPGLTASLDTAYRRPTLLEEELTCHGRIERVEGWKTFARGEIRDSEGRLTAEAEALFIVPKWAREHLGTPTGDAGDFAPAQDPANDPADGPARS